MISHINVKQYQNAIVANISVSTKIVKIMHKSRTKFNSIYLSLTLETSIHKKRDATICQCQIKRSKRLVNF